MKVELAQTDALDRFRFDVFNARDVEKVILVIRNQEALHLRRTYATVRLGDIDHRQIEIRKDID